MSRPYRPQPTGNPLLDAFMASDDVDATAYRDAMGTGDETGARDALSRIQAKILPRSFTLAELQDRDSEASHG